MTNDPTAPLESVTVIVPTLARKARAVRLKRALSSISMQEGVHAIPLVVVNGSEHDAGLLRELEGMAGVRVATVSEAHLGNALLAGRRLVETPWFAELDDDDVLLPNALIRRVERLQRAPDASAIVSNGWFEANGCQRPMMNDVEAVARDPLRAMIDGLWLAAGGALFRTSAIGPEMLMNVPRYLEWTCIALRLAKACRLEFLDDMTFVHYEGGLDGLWGSDECVLGLPEATQQLLDRDVPPSLRATFRRRFTAACNSAAVLEKRRGRFASAWRWHLRCLANGGWRYAGFTRRLLVPSRSKGRTDQ